MKKGVKGMKVWSLIVILMVIGSMFVGVVSAEDVSEDFMGSVAYVGSQNKDNIISDDTGERIVILVGDFVEYVTYTYTITTNLSGSSRAESHVPMIPNWTQPGQAQQVSSQQISYSVPPSSITQTTDAFGLTTEHATWVSIPPSLVIRRNAEVTLITHYGPLLSAAPYPVDTTSLPPTAQDALLPSTFCQSDNPEIQAQAQAILAAGAQSEMEAALCIINWVRHNVKWACPSEMEDYQVDAVYTLHEMKGNCVNFGNLAVALLRAASIPAYPADGLVADRSESCSGHRWATVYFPDVGWMDFETSNWMPTGGNVPVTFLIPQHIQYGRGITPWGIASGDFSEQHNLTFNFGSFPHQASVAHVIVPPGQTLHYVVSVRNLGSGVTTYSLLTDGAPEGWYVAVTDPALLVDSDAPSGGSEDTLLVIHVPQNVTPYSTATITLSARVNDTEVGNVQIVVTVPADTAPPASITNLTNTTGQTWINWTWTNPPDADFNYTMVYLNGTWKANTSYPFYNATGLNPDSSYEIGTHTVDKVGNINATWVNQTTKTQAENIPPIASFIYFPEPPFYVSQLITFNASSSYDIDGNITKYEWNFGDGNITNTTEEVIKHSYSSTGDYNVTLTVTDDDGATNITSKTITVSEKLIFDTGPGTYPSIFGTHNGTIKPNQTITVSKLYTYPCVGTGGHTEYLRIWGNGIDVNATWKGYVGDWHNITFDKTVVLMKNETYNYTIRTGSYPQIHHTSALLTANGWIDCTEFIDANGKVYNDWIPAIRCE